MCMQACRGMHRCVLFVQVHTCTYVYVEVRGQYRVSVSRDLRQGLSLAWSLSTKSSQ